LQQAEEKDERFAGEIPPSAEQGRQRLADHCRPAALSTTQPRHQKFLRIVDFHQDDPGGAVLSESPDKKAALKFKERTHSP
jgi:hypothetical protein